MPDSRVLSKLDGRLVRRAFSATAMLGHLCALYDRGVWEAARLMSNLAFQVTITRGKNVSILRQIGVDANFGLVVDASTMKASENNPLVGFIMGMRRNRFGQMEPSSWLLPHFVLRSVDWDLKLVSLRDWLRTKVFTIGSHSFSRSDIIILLRNQDGGAHCDPQLEQQYAELVESFPASKESEVLIADEPPYKPWENLPEVPLVMMRQIAFELVSALYSQSDLADVVPPDTVFAKFADERIIVECPADYPPVPTVWGNVPKRITRMASDHPLVSHSYSIGR